MTSPIKRAAEYHEVMTVLGKPKPEPVKKSKRVKRGVCPQCGTIWKGEAEHAPNCPQELPMITGTKYKSECDWLELALDELCKLITTWRDGVPCVTPTHECRGVSQWSHFVPQQKSNYLKHDLGNSHRQCAGHNFLHGPGQVQLPYTLFYKSTYGSDVLLAFETARQAFPKYSWTPAEMRERLLDYNRLYEERYQHGTSTMEEKVAAGYYGDIIRECWIKKGRI